MNNQNVRVGMLVQMKDDFDVYAEAGDICEVLRLESDGSHLLINKRTLGKFYRSAYAYRKAPESKE